MNATPTEPLNDPRPVIVIGGGLIGVATLYELTSRGLPCLLLETRDGVAEETSFANGGMQTPSMPDPWNSPGVGHHLLESLFDPRSSMKLRWTAIPGLTLWGLQFLRNSVPSRHEATTVANYHLAAYSTRLTDEWRARAGLSYDYNNAGTLKVFETDASMDAASMLAERLSRHGLRYEILDKAGVISAEPQLAAIRERIVGGLKFPDDRTGDARQFTQSLAARATASGGVIRTGTQVLRILSEGGRAIAVETNAGIIPARAVVLATGTTAPVLAGSHGIRLPIAPAKGYSYTVDASPLGGEMIRIPVIDDVMHAAVVPIGSRLRFVGTAEFAGQNKQIDPVRVDNLKSLFHRLFPHLVERIDLSGGSAWAGLRPMSADGRPIIGASPLPGLWLNCGHGHLGWTKAAGSAKLLADLMQDRATDIDPAPYAYDRRHAHA
ncbi:MAG: FAD-dependent oxidoreductase [Hyphomonas sp.]